MAQAIQQLVLVPGSLCDGRVWNKQVSALSDLAEVTIASLHGFDSLAAMARSALARAPARFALCGFAMGGRVALEMLRLAPDRITRLALVGASVHPVGEAEAERRQPQIELAHAKGMAALARWWNPRLVHPSRRDDPAIMDLLEAMATSVTPQDYEREVHALLHRPDPRPLLAGIRVPVLVLAGADDPLSDPERNAMIAAAIPGAARVEIEGAAHFPMLERPAEFTAALRSWLAA